MKFFSLALLFVSSLSFAAPAFTDSIKIKGMSCSGCEKQVRGVICHDQEMSQWFELCDAKVIDAKNEIGELRYTMKPGQKLDAEKYAKIEKAIIATGRSIQVTRP